MFDLGDVKISEAYVNSIILRLCEFANGSSEFYKTDELGMVINSYIKAMKYFFEKFKDEPLYLDGIKELAKTFFEDWGLNYSLRTTNVIIGNNDFQPADKTKVPYMLQEALQFHNMNCIGEKPFSFSPVVSDLDIFENEALFHIALVRIQPFDDGNKRIANLLTTLNFLRYYGMTGIMPPILRIGQRAEYFKAIKNNDYKILAEVYRLNSQREKGDFGHMVNGEESTNKL